MPKRNKIWILGAGLAGLTAASKLKQKSCLIERNNKAGGLCDTSTYRGFRFDRTGHLLHLKDPAVKKFVLETLDKKPQKIVRKAKIFFRGGYTHYPFQANLGGLPPKIAASCLSGFIKASIEKVTSPRSFSTFEQYIYGHFGEGIAKHFMIPYNTKLWGVHPRRITSKWCRLFVPQPSISDVASGAMGFNQNHLGYNASFYFPHKGIGELTDSLLSRIDNIVYNTKIDTVDYRKKQIKLDGEWKEYKSIINTIPLDEFASLLLSPPKKIKDAARLLKCTSLRYLDAGLSCQVPYHWVYIPEKKYPFYRVGCYSNFSSSMAPKNKSNLYIELTSRRKIVPEKIYPKVISGLKEMGFIRTKKDVEFFRPRKIDKAYVIYDSNHQRCTSTILTWLEKQGIFCAGRYARWEYSSMEDAMRQGITAASKVKKL